MLETKHFPGHHTGVSISEKLQETLTSYKVNMESVSAIVHDEASNAVLAGECMHIGVCTICYHVVFFFWTPKVMLEENI